MQKKFLLPSLLHISRNGPAFRIDSCLMSVTGAVEDKDNNTYENKARYQQSNQRCLWKRKVPTTIISTGTEVVGDVDYINDESLHHLQFPSYDDIYAQHIVRAPRQQQRHKKQRPIFRHIANTLLVVQEFALTCYFLAWHRIMTTIMMLPPAQDGYQHRARQQQQQFYIDMSMTSMYIALLLAVIINAHAVAATTSSVINYQRNATATTRSTTSSSYYLHKLLYRILDATILACIVRYIAALLRNLTASFSTDTVETLAVNAMIIHVLFCDYTYANAYDYHFQQYRQIQQEKLSAKGNCSKENIKRKESFQKKEYLSTASTLTRHQYYKSVTTFMGGTISLNAAFFATILLSSRFPSTTTITTTGLSATSTNAATTSTFMFISLSVIIFAFYPVTRNTISCVYPSHRSGTSSVLQNKLPVVEFGCYFLSTTDILIVSIIDCIKKVVHWLITVSITVSTQCLLFVLDEQTKYQKRTSDSSQFTHHFTTYTNKFWVVYIVLGLIIPIWKSYISQFKVVLRGPWDIPTRDVMNLDYKL